jgi:hypothetical protein
MRPMDKELGFEITKHSKYFPFLLKWPPMVDEEMEKKLGDLI